MLEIVGNKKDPRCCLRVGYWFSCTPQTIDIIRDIIQRRKEIWRKSELQNMASKLGWLLDLYSLGHTTLCPAKQAGKKKDIPSTKFYICASYPCMTKLYFDHKEKSPFHKMVPHTILS